MKTNMYSPKLIGILLLSLHQTSAMQLPYTSFEIEAVMRRAKRGAN